MTSIIKLQAMSGVYDESPHCYLLQVDEFKFLLDCGWDESLNMAFVKELKKHTNQIDAVLLSYPDVLHLGALPYMVGKCSLNCPIYATIPVYKMGQMFMYDLFQSRHNTEEFDLFTLDDVDAAFDKIIQLKYSQTVSLKGKGQGLSITPLPAGHMIGGTIWRIVKDGEEDILYAVDFNHKKERHLNGCVLESVSRPSLLITDAYNATYNQPRRRLRDEQLMTNILQTLRNNGNVLIAVDTAGRVLELAHMLDQLWKNQDSGLMAYSLALFNNVSYNVVEFAKSQVEWMSDKIMRSFEGARNNPFQFKHLQLCHTMIELNKVSEPKRFIYCNFRELEVSDSSEGSDDEMEVDGGGKTRHDLMINTEGKPRGGGFFKQAKKSYPMFPMREEKIKWDDYGEIIRAEDFMIVEPNPAEEEPKDVKEEADETMQDITEVPTKCISTTKILDINASVQFIDFEGRSDSESIKKIISLIKPRRLILIRGTEDSIDALKVYCRTTGAVQGKIFSPKLYEIVDATTESHIYQVKLKDSLVSSIEFARAKDAELAWIDGEIMMQELEKVVEKDIEIKEADEIESNQELIPTLQSLPQSLVPGHTTIFVNELKLSDFKQVLLRAGIHAEFSGGVLYCNNTVAVRRNETGRINLEGCLSEDYYKVRELLYSQYAII
ncbi:cleavage and polyadenylation specificity factor subunit 2-like [Centruroides sculpturatus]|uniref:cleavage and polyadenylation specificity factor subunit 2-like n=1 Tax=Centruroides sculpturatus TaxID=218467 RepID=UPI000C6CA061|nr:cleavage and polyadenylation specificity factor subunit 2-like [Centruroides sculpturatus]